MIRRALVTGRGSIVAALSDPKDLTVVATLSNPRDLAVVAALTGGGSWVSVDKRYRTRS